MYSEVIFFCLVRKKRDKKKDFHFYQGFSGIKDFEKYFDFIRKNKLLLSVGINS